jgi:hypothetical protein
MMARRCHRRPAWPVVVLLAIGAGCSDKAAPGLASCRGYEAQGDLEKAAMVCSEAALADPGSKAGKEARGLVDLLRAEAARRRQRDEAEVLARAENAVKQSEAACGSHDWVTICDIGPHPGALQHFPTKRGCATFGSAPGVRCQGCRCY